MRMVRNDCESLNAFRLGDIISFSMGSTPPKVDDNYDGELPWITISNLKSKNIFEYTSRIKVSKKIKVLPKGTLLGSFKMSVGRFGFATENCCTNEAIIAIKKEDTEQSLDYLYYLLPQYFIKNANKNAQGVLLLNTQKIKDIVLSIHSLEQQQRIADVLSKQESIISKTKELISELDKRNTFMLDELLSGRLRIKEENGAITFYKNPEDNWQSVIMNGEEKQIPKDWNIDLLSNRISFGMGSTPKKESDNYNGDLPWVTIANLKNKYLKSYTALIKRSIKNVKIIPKESLLGSFKMSVGRFSITTFDCATNEAIISISKKDTSFDLDYLYYYLPKIFKENATLNAQGIPLLNTKSIKKIQIIFSDKKNQENIAKFLSSLDSEKEKYEELLIEEQKKFDFLLEELMSGRLRIEE